VRSGNVHKIYINGVADANTWTNASNYTSQTCRIGKYYLDATNGWNGWLDEFRISKGRACWTANFTPPTAAYTASAYPTSQTYYLTTADSSQINTTGWTDIPSITLTQTTPTNTSIKHLVSFDGCTTWKYWNGSAWTSSTLADIGTNGMSKAVLEAITSAQWKATGGFVAGTTTSLNFAAGLATTDNTVAPVLGKINITFAKSALAATSNDVTVNTAAASKLGFTQQPSSTAIAGAAFTLQPQVIIQDAYNNTITTDNATQITLSRGAKGTAALQGTTLTLPVTAGVATFSGLSYNKAEIMNILASTTSYTAATSNDVTVSPAALDHFTVTGIPDPATAGTAASDRLLRHAEYRIVHRFGDHDQWRAVGYVELGCSDWSGFRRD